MKHLLIILLPILFYGCGFSSNPNPPLSGGLYLYDLVWTSDGEKIIVNADSTTPNGDSFRSIRVYDKEGSPLHTYMLPKFFYFNRIWATTDDTTFISYTSSAGVYSVFRYYLESGTTSQIAGGLIYAESFDNHHLLVGPYTYQNRKTDFLAVDISEIKPRLQGSWFEATPGYTNAVWINYKNVGYFRYNSFNLIDFAIVDTNGVTLDSFDVSGIQGLSGVEVFYGPGAFYFVNNNGILKYDSAAKTNSFLLKDYIFYSAIASDGSFIVYESGNVQPSLRIINTKTGVSKSLSYSADHLKISPLNDKLAYIDKSTSYEGKLVIIPVSAP